MNRIFLVAGATIREHSRRRTLIFFGVVSALVTAGSIYFVLTRPDLASLLGANLTLPELTSLGLFSLLATIVTLVISMGNIRPLFASGDADAMLSRPITRTDLVAGRTLGSVMLVIGSCFAFGAASQIISMIAGEGLSMDLVGHWVSEAFNLIVLCLMTTLLSGWFKAPAIVAVCGYLADQVVTSIQTFYQMVESGTLAGTVAKVIKMAWWVSPKYLPSPLLEKTGLVGQPSLQWTLVLWAAGWSALLMFFIVKKASHSEAF
ncbi:MAG TPA: hypothetical protein VI541_00755 [Actinomycetota bacterium]|nr:hypothetical protein [Actinomycetota bacterium]